MTDRKTDAIIVAGHSHTAALIGGGSGPDAEICLMPVEGHDRVFGLHGPWICGYPVRNGYYWSALARYAPGNAIALLFYGNEHNTHFLFEQPPRFDFLPRGLPGLPVEADSVIVAESLIRAKFRSLLAPPLQGLLTYLKVQTDARIVLVGTPPPKRDYEGFQNVFAPQYPEVTLTSPIKMLKLWHVLQEAYQEQAERNGLEFISVPDNVMDDDGFLKLEFADVDITHANRAYGQVMLDHLTRQLLRD